MDKLTLVPIRNSRMEKMIRTATTVVVSGGYTISLADDFFVVITLLIRSS